MHNSIGNDRMKLVREAYSAALRAAAFSSSEAGLMPRIFFWLGQMMPHTLSSMIVPSHPPMPSTVALKLGSPTRPKVNVLTKVEPSSQAPNTQVATAPQRNHQSARGATYLLTPAPPGPPLSAAASARAGVCTALK